jgi:hypothetical protein
MSSAAAKSTGSSEQAAAGSTPGKKKFGKNLNKQLPKPPTAPTASSKQASSQSKNGLLLLSTKRSSSSGVNNSGILANKGAATSSTSPSKAAALPNLGLQYEPSPTTHEALLGAVVGASRAAEAQQQQPDAWGVAHNKEEYDEGVEERQHDRMASVEKEQRREQLRAQEEARVAEQKERAAQKLQELESKMYTPEGPLIHADVNSGDRGTVTSNRTLFDPNEGQGNSPRNGPSAPRGNPRSVQETSTASNTSPSFAANDEFSRGPSQNQAPTPVIHLSSYEDRDRGDRGTSSGPRMLYDPKSGSMVAVPVRGESSSNNAKARKERGKKVKGKEKLDATPDKAKKGKGRKEERQSPSTKPDPRKARAINTERKLPRTCGVLYKRDGRGGTCCADGCDGDLGYGAHSVPGGRARNPGAYQKYLERQAQLEENGESYDENKVESYNMLESEDENAVALETGFNVVEQDISWVKPNEKISLVTGVDGSPTLQATAKEWAPTFSAIPSSAQVSNSRSQSFDEDNEEDEDEDDGPVSIFIILNAWRMDVDRNSNKSSCFLDGSRLRSSFAYGFYDAITISRAKAQ